MAVGRAILTFTRSWQALAAVRSLGARGVEVVAGDEYELTPGGLSSYAVGTFTYPSASEDPEGFLDAIDRAIDEHRPEGETPYVLMPIHRESYLLARHRERFEDRVRIAAPSAELIDRVRDKGRLAEWARQAGVPVPATWTPGDDEELRGLLDEIELPAFVKARSGAGGVGIECVESREALVEAWRRIGRGIDDPELKPFIQQKAKGDDYCVTALFDGGTKRAMLTYRNVRKIHEGAPGAVRETVEAGPPEAAAEELLSALEWHGIAQVDFLWDGTEEGTPYLIEVNPRFFGGLFQAIASGVDYPWMLWQMALGEEPDPPGEIEIGRRTETPVVGLLATLREALEEAGSTERLERAWSEAREIFDRGTIGEAAAALFEGLKEGLAAEERVDIVRRLLEERQENVSQLFSGDDPRAAFGLVYPLAVFLRHGKVTPDLLMGVGDDADGDA